MDICHMTYARVVLHLKGVLLLQGVAGLVYNAPLLLDILEKLHFPNTQETVTAQFFSQWINDYDCFFG